jgi:prevent-host-death family protein
MKKVTLKKVQARLPEYVASVAKGPVVIVDNGRPVAMLVGLPPSEKRAGSVKLRDVLRRSWKEYQLHGGIPHEQFWEELVKEAAKR